MGGFPYNPNGPSDLTVNSIPVVVTQPGGDTIPDQSGAALPANDGMITEAVEDISLQPQNPASL